MKHVGPCRAAIAGIVALGIEASAAQAGIMVFETPAGVDNLNGNPVDARATFTTSTNSLTILLENLLADPTASNQFLSGLQFTLSGSPLGQTFVGGSAVQMNLDSSDGSYDLLNGGSAVATTRWHLTATPDLTALGGGQPSELLIGPPNGSNLYAHANGGADNFNPNLWKSATFTLAYSGNPPSVTDLSTISNVKFEFGTNPSAEGIIDGVPVTPTIHNPEPASLALWSVLGMLGLHRLRRRTRVVSRCGAV